MKYIFTKQDASFIILIILFLVVPIVTFATTTLSNITDATVIGCTGANCNFNNLLTLISVVIDFFIYGLAMPVSAVMFAVAGWKMMTAGDNPSQVQEAKTIFQYVAIGLIVTVGAWLIVSAVLDGLQVKDGGANDFNLLK